MLFEKKKRIQNRELLDYIKSQRCLIFNGCRGPVDPSHVTTRGAGGDDTPDNVMPLCRKHHNEWGWSAVKFIQKYPVARRWLESHNRWDFLDRVDNLEFDFTNNTLPKICD